jgi:hypothetical protein
MKRLPCILVFSVLVTLLASSCKKDGIEYGYDYSQSLHKWQAFKDSSNNSYRYKVTAGSWVGYGWETTITIKNGKPVGRSFLMQGRLNGSATITTMEEWTEDENSLLTHDRGASPETLDAIYKKAKEDWLQRRDNTETYFEAKNNGMISTCGYRDKNCADDCFIGIRIRFIEAI